MSSQPSSLNNIMAKNLLAGAGDFVRGLQQMGFRYNNPLEQVTVLEAEPPFPQANTFFGEGSFEVSRHSLFQWSLLSSQNDGVDAWLVQVGNLLAPASLSERREVLDELLSQVLKVNVPPLPQFPAHFGGFIQTWRFLQQWEGKGWERSLTEHAIFRQLLSYGDVSGAFLNNLIQHQLWGKNQFKSPDFQENWRQLLGTCIPRGFPRLAETMLKISHHHKFNLPALVTPNLLENALRMTFETDDVTWASPDFQTENFLRSSGVFLALLPYFQHPLSPSLHRGLEDALAKLQHNSSRQASNFALSSGIQKLLLRQSLPASANLLGGSESVNEISSSLSLNSTKTSPPSSTRIRKI